MSMWSLTLEETEKKRGKRKELETPRGVRGRRQSWWLQRLPGSNALAGSGSLCKMGTVITTGVKERTSDGVGWVGATPVEPGPLSLLPGTLSASLALPPPVILPQLPQPPKTDCHTFPCFQWTHLPSHPYPGTCSHKLGW